MIVSSGETKIFEKKLKKGVTKQGGNLDSQWCRGDVFFRFFRKTTAQLGQILEITPVEGECNTLLCSLLFRRKWHKNNSKSVMW